MNTSHRRGWSARGVLSGLSASVLFFAHASFAQESSSVSGQAVSLPSGAGTVSGMGANVQASLSTGAVGFSIPFDIPRARGLAQPSLGLSYSSSRGSGAAGMGWAIGGFSIARQTDKGRPRYADSAPTVFNPDQDRFVFNDSQELVPICIVTTSLSCAGALKSGSHGVLEDEVMPAWAAGWQYFRPRVEQSFMRFFWSPDRLTWRVQSKSGVTLELGVPLDAGRDRSALEADPANVARVFKWHIARQYDTLGNANPTIGNPTPANSVVYRYRQAGGLAHLADIYYTPPATAEPALGAYAHHVHLEYATRSDPSDSFAATWLQSRTLRLIRVDVASKPFAADGARELVRRYHLGYDAGYTTSFLSAVQEEGRCAVATAEATTGLLPASDCPRLPAAILKYSHVSPLRANGAAGSRPITGYEGFDERSFAVLNAPAEDFAVGDNAFLDVNSDGLVDLISTAPQFGAVHRVYLNGADGAAASFRAINATLTGTDNANAGIINLANPNVALLDFDGDTNPNFMLRRSDFEYEVFAPLLQAGNLVWQGRVTSTLGAQNPTIDFGQDNPDLRSVDVDGDGLVDVVSTKGDSIETFFALGRYPGGDGQFGTARRTSATQAEISNEPVRTCLPRDPSDVRFSDASREYRLADMNGDGLPDIVRVRANAVAYWPGRGDGNWGAAGCDDPARLVAMGTTSPDLQPAAEDAIRIADINGDGLDDLVQVGSNAVDVWLNLKGKGWSAMATVSAPGFDQFRSELFQVADLNGNGTKDLVWAEADGMKYIDLTGPIRPGLLRQLQSGLGVTSSVDYVSSTQAMLAAANAGRAWATAMPTVVYVAAKTSATNGLQIAGASVQTQTVQYTFRDPAFDYRQREFRGFKNTEVKSGSATGTTFEITSTEQLVGECSDEIASDGVDDCSPRARDRDNPNEALKGLEAWSDVRNEANVFQRTSLHSYALRTLYTGLDGRKVTQAFENGSESWAYDTAPFTPAASNVSVVVAKRQAANGTLTNLITLTVPRRASLGTARLAAASNVDGFGNALVSSRLGVVDVDETLTNTQTYGRPTGEPTGWLYRPMTQTLSGSKHAGWTPILKSEYDVAGQVIRQSAVLAGTVSLQTAVAGAPLDQSGGSTQPVTVVTSQRYYDAFGNVVREVGASKRCSDFKYDAQFFQHQVRKIDYSLGCGAGTATSAGVGPLTTSATHDRGLQKPLTITDERNQVSRVVYDGFGRTIELYRPLSTIPSQKFEYRLAKDSAVGLPSNIKAAALPNSGQAGVSVVMTSTQDGPKGSSALYAQQFEYTDGNSVQLATLAEAEPQAGTTQSRYVLQQTGFDDRARPNKKFQAAFFSGDPWAWNAALASISPYALQRFDSFGRGTEKFDLDGTQTERRDYHALALDVRDAADIEPGPRQGTYITERKDGHGRVVELVERHKATPTSAIELRRTLTAYIPTGKVETITRVRGATTQQVTRWIAYDTLGRMVLNAEPHSTVGYAFKAAPNLDANHETRAAALTTLRYAYNDAGDMVGTSDTRGCGVNYTYDALGRTLTEDLLPCSSDQPAYTAPLPAAGPHTSGVEVRYDYDTLPALAERPPGLSLNATLSKGRLVRVRDRAGEVFTRYDARGRVTGKAVRIARPGSENEALGSAYASRWYVQSATFDMADRQVTTSTGATVAELLGKGGVSSVTGVYDARGGLRMVKSSYTMSRTTGTTTVADDVLVARIDRTADGLTEAIQLGDRVNTETTNEYDARRRLRVRMTARARGSSWPTEGSPESGATDQMLLQHDLFTYDSVSNPTKIEDLRNADEWPAGAKPVTRSFAYDDLNRVVGSSSTYASVGALTDDTWTSAFADEEAAIAAGATDELDTRRGLPLPQVSFAKRMKQQTFAYDWLGNLTSSTDDASGFFDRSLGTATPGTLAAAPYQLKSSKTTSGARGGSLQTRFDTAGNLVGLAVARSGPCLPAGALCSHSFAYSWDEQNRLVRARRWDHATLVPATAEVVTGSIPTIEPVVDVRYAYNSTGDRVLRSTRDATASEREQLHTLFVFNSLEIRGAHWRETDATPDYELNALTEVPYLVAGGVRIARVVFEPNTPTGLPPTLRDFRQRVLYELPDHLGSTAVVIDRESSELLERSTLQPYGRTESDYRPSRWAAYRADSSFSGKEQDVELGIMYFGHRYYVPSLGRWASPDPLALHSPGSADLNLYAYVSGRLLRSVDPTGLEGLEFAPPAPPPEAIPTVVSRHGNQIELSNLEVVGSIPTDPAELANLGIPATGPTSAADYGEDEMWRGLDSMDQRDRELVMWQLKHSPARYVFQNLPGGDITTHGVMMQRQLFTNSMAWTAAGTVGAGAAAVAVMTAPEWVPAVGGRALIRTVGGAISGGLGPAIAGKSGGEIAQGAIVGAAFSAWNPFDAVSKAGWTGAAIAGGMNSGSTNFINQGINMNFRGRDFNMLSLEASVVGGVMFGGIYGNTDASQLGIPIQGMVMQQSAKGIAGGLTSGAVSSAVTF